ncbi:hypothetical protein GCM10007852_04820 [Agaribacter marinus]|uniref:Uncharacterized protein n=1 Tax=Agaribacter marinus TaxID=1431249 RepID=A0AA37WIJ3_9ALTE|nr:hypothetical protein GCM10007852_04820 [Agaribacter marinus]
MCQDHVAEIDSSASIFVHGKKVRASQLSYHLKYGHNDCVSGVLFIKADPNLDNGVVLNISDSISKAAPNISIQWSTRKIIIDN